MAHVCPRCGNHVVTLVPVVSVKCVGNTAHSHKPAVMVSK